LRKRTFSWRVAVLLSTFERIEERAPEMKVNEITPKIIRKMQKILSIVVLAE
jgi:hypothetical protein